jgi:prevent-host-death family protein
MKSWPVQDAKSRFGEFLKASLTEGPQVVTLRGVETAVLETVQEWRSLHARARPTLNVVSELRKVKPHQGVVSWIQDAPEESLYISAVTVGEIQAG